MFKSKRGRVFICALIIALVIEFYLWIKFMADKWCTDSQGFRRPVSSGKCNEADENLTSNQKGKENSGVQAAVNRAGIFGKMFRSMSDKKGKVNEKE